MPYINKTTFKTYVSKCVQKQEETLYGDFIRMDKKKDKYGYWKVYHNGKWKETCGTKNCLDFHTYYIKKHIRDRFPEFAGRCVDCVKWNIS